MIQLHLLDSDGPVMWWVNPKHIVYVMASGSGSVVELTNRTLYKVIEVPNDIDQKMLRDEPLQAIAGILDEPGGRFGR
jgi:hypothetical protein